MSLRDDLGHTFIAARPTTRIVSLVPSLTEAIAATRREALVAATDWCTHPGDLDVARVRGTKNPDVAAIIRLAPEIVIANREENRELDVRRLREAGIPVWVTEICSVPQALASMRRMFTEALSWDVPPWLEQAEQLWLPTAPNGARPAAITIWRDPWMAVGGDTFTGDLAARVGLRNVFADSPERYPHTTPADICARGAELVVLPDEPYAFSAEDGPEEFVAFDAVSTVLVDGRLLTWYGPSLLAAYATLHAAFS